MEANQTLANSTAVSMERLQMENILLLEENKKLSETIDWMHDTIWRLVRTQRPEI